MMRGKLLSGAALGLLAVPAAAEVKSASAHGFEVESRAVMPLSPDQLYRAFARLPSWWSDAHTYSGKASNLSLELRPGGCWCETLPEGGGVEHMRVAHVEPGKRLVLTGALGPLLGEATTGVMQVSFAPSGQGSSLVVNYRVAGFHKGGAEQLAPLVDGVLSEAVGRLAASAREPAAR